MRLRQAEETLQEAETLAAAGQWRGVVNRAYYAMFYAGLALLAGKQIRTSKHSGSLAMFNLHFVKSGLFPSDLARSFRQAFHSRDAFDYKRVEQPTEEEATEARQAARQFVARACSVAERFLSGD
jgi:uncharacterized protein (UPF0332 family)